MSNPHQRLVRFVLDKAALEPALVRIELYRATAEIAGNPGTTKELLVIADELERAERRFQEFRFKLNQQGAAR